jgi:hypothetical protein
MWLEPLGVGGGMLKVSVEEIECSENSCRRNYWTRFGPLQDR